MLLSTARVPWVSAVRTESFSHGHGASSPLCHRTSTSGYFRSSFWNLPAEDAASRSCGLSSPRSTGSHRLSVGVLTHVPASASATCSPSASVKKPEKSHPTPTFSSMCGPWQLPSVGPSEVRPSASGRIAGALAPTEGIVRIMQRAPMRRIGLGPMSPF